MNAKKVKGIGLWVVAVIVAAFLVFIFVFPNVQAATKESGCAEIAPGSPFYMLPSGSYTDLKTGAEWYINKAIASETVMVSDGKPVISGLCQSTYEDMEVWANLPLVDEEGNLHTVEYLLGDCLSKCEAYGENKTPLP